MTLDLAKPSSIWQAELPWFAKNDTWRIPIGEIGDQLIQAAIDARRLCFPSRTPDKRSLALTGLDRRIPRAPDEPVESYVRRLLLWLDLWGIAGLPLGLLYACQSFIFPGYPTVRLVERNGLWHTLEPFASRDLTPYEAMTVPAAVGRYVPPIGAAETPRAEFWMHYGPWPDWDSIAYPAFASNVWDYLLIIDPPSYPHVGQYNAGLTYNSGVLWGLQSTAGTIDTLRELIRSYSRAGSHCLAVVFPDVADRFTATSTPDADWPDGYWRAESKDDGFGNTVPTRSDKNRYLLGFQ